MVVLNKDDLPTGAFIHFNQFYPSAKWVCGWVHDEEGGYQTCYCVFPVGFGTPNPRWELSVDNTINDVSSIGFGMVKGRGVAKHDGSLLT